MGQCTAPAGAAAEMLAAVFGHAARLARFSAEAADGGCCAGGGDGGLTDALLPIPGAPPPAASALLSQAQALMQVWSMHGV